MHTHTWAIHCRVKIVGQHDTDIMLIGVTVTRLHRYASPYISCALMTFSINTVVRLLMAKSYELLNFEWGIVVGDIWIENFTSEVMGIFDITQFTVSYIYLGYMIEGIATHFGQHSNKTWIVTRGLLVRIDCCNKWHISQPHSV